MTRRSFLQSSSAALIASGSYSAGAAQTIPQVFPFGTHIYREPPLPAEQLHADLPLLKRLGFTMVKIQESWSVDEPAEGAIDLSRISRLVADARQNGLLIYFGITMEQAPAWLWKKYPDAFMVWESGERALDPTQYLLPNDGKPGPCWNHPGARAVGVRFVEALAREIGKFDNILAWNCWQEVTVDFEMQGHPIGLCYCPNTLAAFRDWLRSKYQTLDNLNRNWRVRYSDWGQVEPPRRFQKVPSMIDWRYFMEDVYLAEAMRWKADAFRRADPLHRRVFAHTGSPRFGGSADWRISRVLDFYGSSCYPSWGEYQDPGVSDEQRLLNSPAVWEQVLDNALKWDYLRAASPNEYFWTAELQGGRAGGGVNPGRVPDPGDIRRWVLGALAGGARGVCFWNHRSEKFWDEAYGFGLLELVGDETPRALEAGRLGKALNEHVDLFTNGTCPPAPAAIVIDENLWNFVISSGEPLKTNFLSNLRGIHRSLWEQSISIDFIDTPDIARAWPQYKALIHPLPICLSDKSIAAINAYVQQGGTLISGPLPGRFDGYGFGMPGEMPAPLGELFGVEHKQVLTLSGRQPHPSQSSSTPSDTKPLMLTGANAIASFQVEASYYLQYLTTKNAEPLLRYGSEITGSVNRAGSGRAYLIGTLLDPGRGQNQTFLAELLKTAGVTSDRCGKLLRRRRVKDNQAAWFLFNPRREGVEETLDLTGYRSAADLLGGPVAMEDQKGRIKAGPADVLCLVLEKS
ncbi:MAG: beta-galactosidase [Deltaproteobacteria bacterium]|nr:beta-galactosidase [Deltaproteobacteria bacterium]